MWLLAHSICLPEQEAEFLPTSSSDIELLAQSKLKVIPEKFCSQDSLTEAYLHSLSGTMSPHFDQTTPQPQAISNGCEKGVGNSSSVAGSPNFAKTLAPLEKAQESMAQDRECGRTWRESFAKYSPDSCLWKTAQCSLLADSDEFSETWPRWGSMRNGESYQRPMLALPISESESGYWPTPCVMDSRTDQMLGGATVYMDSTGKPRRKTEKGTASMGLARIVQYANLIPTPTVNGNYNRKGLSKTSGDGLATYVAKFATSQARDFRSGSKSRWDDPARSRNLNDQIATSAESGRLNPDWVEWLMGWPIGATALSPLAMDKFHEWQQQHGSCFLNDSTIKAK